VLFTRLIAEAGLDALLAPIDELPYRKLSIDCPDARKRPVMAALAAELPELFPAAAITTEHGLRVEFPDDGWALVRPSGTEPKLRIYAESATVDAVVEPLTETLERLI
jgi:Phosphomannomutase